MSPQSILIVDDDALLRKTVSDVLRVKGYSTFSAGSGKEALAFVRGNPVDVVLLDLGLPDMPGLEVLNEVKAHSPSKSSY